jgi:formylglycine-generating enzyme required for sulfatase activity
VPQIHLEPEHYDYAAYTELTETFARAKDSVFGVYGSILLSELVGRKRLGTLTDGDRGRYLRLQPLYPELLSPLARVDSVTNSVGLQLVRIPVPREGSLLGSLRSDPEHRPDEVRHPVSLAQPFFMARCKVTNAQMRMLRADWHSPAYRGLDLDGDQQPAVNVGYDDAQAFIAWLNVLPAEQLAGRRYRLPTEEEWEVAAKGGDDRRFPWGDQWPPPPESGNFGDESTAQAFPADWPTLHGYRDGWVGTSPVGTFPPNPFFLFDMAGNAYEWTSSEYVAYPGAPEDQGPHAPPSRPYGAGTRVIRGSSWADELPKVLRCAFRNPVAPQTRFEFLGFRVVADIPALE